MQQKKEHDMTSMLSFYRKEGDILPEQVFGLRCADANPCESFQIQTDRGYADSRLACTQKSGAANTCVTHQFLDGLRLDTHWEYHDNILRRCDILTAEKGNATVYRFQTKLYLLGRFAMYSHRNHWCRENQGMWEELRSGVKTLRSPGARSGNGCSPYLCLYRAASRAGIAVHFVPGMDWQLSAEAVFVGEEHPYTVLSSGPDDAGYAYLLHEGDSVCLSDLILTGLAQPEPELGAAALQKYLLSVPDYQRNGRIPIAYNSWFLNWDHFTTRELEEQLTAAVELGCEAFIIDAGWFGQMSGNWIDQIGDWREKRDGAFHGEMLAFAEEVRAKGLVFGLWMEPERYDRKVPVVQEHPDWFIDQGTEKVYPDLQHPEAYAFVLDTMCSVIEHYGVGWIKIDFNHVLGRDPHAIAHAGYLTAWYGIVKELRRRYPALILENCASGSMRLDLESLKHYDVFFPTDVVNAVNSLRICVGHAVRMLPGRLLRWMAIGSRGIPTIHGSVDSAEQISLDFAVRTCLFGQLSLTGNLSALSQEEREKLKGYIAFAKNWRKFLYDSVGISLLPAAGIDDRQAFAALLMLGADAAEALLFAYRVNGDEASCRLLLRELDPCAAYRVVCYDEGELGVYSGERLMTGLDLSLPERFTAKILHITKVS